VRDLTDDYTDWVYEQIREAMRAAGQRFIDAHSDLFRGGIT
jgi:hypothetical protein